MLSLGESDKGQILYIIQEKVAVFLIISCYELHISRSLSHHFIEMYWKVIMGWIIFEQEDLRVLAGGISGTVVECWTTDQHVELWILHLGHDS